MSKGQTHHSAAGSDRADSSFTIPAEMRALVLNGKGFEHLGVRKVPTPRPGPRQMLARVDAASICTSLIKLVEQGPDHKFIYGRDIARHPLILGDEGAVTVVEVGEELRNRYQPGARYVLQPAVDHPPLHHREWYRDNAKGVMKIAFGYTLGGHLAEYVLIPEEALAADCLLPLPDPSICYAHASLSEPIACCIFAQEHHVHQLLERPASPRRTINGLTPGGVTVIIGAGVMGRMHVDLSLSYRPRAVVVADLLESRLAAVRTHLAPRAQKLGIALHTINPKATDLRSLVNELTDDRGADDVIVAVGSATAMQSALSLVGRGAVLDLFGGLKKGEEVVGFDTGIIHYQGINVTGSSGGYPWDLARALELMAAREIDAGIHVTRVGDLEHSPDFLRLIITQEIDGKAVVYPHRRTQKIHAVKSWSAQDEQDYLQKSED